MRRRQWHNAVKSYNAARNFVSAINKEAAMNFDITRTLRTPHSERFLLSEEGADFAALDIHFLVDGRVNATLTLFETAKVSEQDLPSLLSELDDRLLPDVSVADSNLIFTVVRGTVIGAFTAGA